MARLVSQILSAALALTAFTASAFDTVDGSVIFDAGNGPSFAAAIQANSVIKGEIANVVDTHDYYTFTATTSGILTVSLGSLIADLDLHLLDANLNVLGKSIEYGTASEKIAFTVQAGSKYFIAITPFEEAVSSYQMTLSMSGGTPAATISPERFFAFAEGAFPTLFIGTPLPGVDVNYGHIYRYYSQTRNYLALDNAGGILYIGPQVGNNWVRIAGIADFLPEIIRWEGMPSVPSAPPPVANMFSLTTGAVGTGRGRVTPASGNFAPGTLVDVYAQPEFFTDFVGWTDRTTQLSCVGRTLGCQIRMDQNHIAEAKFVPTSFITDFDGPYNLSRTDVSTGRKCNYFAQWTNTKIEITNIGTGKLRVTGQQVAIRDAASPTNCLPGNYKVDKTFDLPNLVEGSSLNVRFMLVDGTGDQYLTIRASLPAAGLGGTAAFTPAELIFDYTNAPGATGNMTLFKTLQRVPKQ